MRHAALDPDASDRHGHPAADPRSRHAGLPHLLRHYLEMVVAM